MLGYNWRDMSDIMQSDSVRAYDLEKRVAAYDSDMEIMHPLRSKMAEVLLEVLPWAKTEALRGVDLGVGTGLLTARFLYFGEDSAYVRSGSPCFFACGYGCFYRRLR